MARVGGGIGWGEIDYAWGHMVVLGGRLLLMSAGFGVEGRVQRSACGGSHCRVEGAACRVQGSGCRVHGAGVHLLCDPGGHLHQRL